VRFQRFTTPAWGEVQRRGERFAHDFVAWRALGPAGAEVPACEQDRTWLPAQPLSAARDLCAFAAAYLGLVHGRMPTGFVA
jgi:hypothetical protein